MQNTTENKIEIILIRHGMTKGNLKKAYIGKNTDEGLLDSEILRIAPVKFSEGIKVFSSPLRRCIQTANCLFPKEDIIVIDELSETDFGEFEGKNYEQLKDEESYIQWIKSNGRGGFLGGEGFDEFIQRSLRGFYKVIDKVKDTKRIYLIVHGGTICSILSTLCNGDYFDYMVKNLCGYKLSVRIKERNVICDTVETFTAIK